MRLRSQKDRALHDSEPQTALQHVRAWLAWHVDTMVPILVCGLVLAILMGLGGLVWVVRSHYEARAFTRVTGQPVTTWDAMWLSLRVDCR